MPGFGIFDILDFWCKGHIFVRTVQSAHIFISPSLELQLSQVVFCSCIVFIEDIDLLNKVIFFSIVRCLGM